MTKNVEKCIMLTETYIAVKYPASHVFCVNVFKEGVILEDVRNIAAYICNRYQEEFGEQIDEMKLHKLLYFSQRESLIRTDALLFDATFYGWKYGPVLKEIRSAYRDGSVFSDVPEDVVLRIQPLMDVVFREYAGKDAWSLSRLTHGELSWKNSRMGIAQTANSDNPISNEDIRKDALRIRERREKLRELGLL